MKLLKSLFVEKDYTKFSVFVIAVASCASYNYLEEGSYGTWLLTLASIILAGVIIEITVKFLLIGEL